ncbi:uncharacterized protein PG998_004728 [Apiospora kogelbergensis]|uniref:Uncharacterized protein n=1 Tax=Apiospora kogelbergensis TaxID=1337665 RepID=A0AAW0QCS5_9PEZI
MFLRATSAPTPYNRRILRDPRNTPNWLSLMRRYSYIGSRPIDALDTKTTLHDQATVAHLLTVGISSPYVLYLGWVVAGRNSMSAGIGSAGTYCVR